jgi:hypothetical protein
MYKLTIGPLEHQTWIVQTGTNINSVVSDAIVSTVEPDGSLKLTNASTKANGGGLITVKLPFPDVGIALPYVGLDLDFYVSGYDLPLLGRLECDIKAVQTDAKGATINNTANGSTQLNMSEGGMWQIDNAGRVWTDTGYKPGLPIADTWTHLSNRYVFNFAANQFSVSSIAQGNGAAPYGVPGALQQLALQPSNWASVVAVQLQTEILQPGGLNTIYKNIFVTFSDTAF